MPQVTYVQEFKIDKDLKKIRVKRALEDGYEEIEIETPCMLTAIKELNQPRYMNIKGIFDPEKKITTWLLGRGHGSIRGNYLWRGTDIGLVPGDPGP